jgi:plasmid stabilization system protein ParE
VKVEWTEPALQDLEQHVAYLAQFNPYAAVELAASLFAMGESLSLMPERGRIGRIPVHESSSPSIPM